MERTAKVIVDQECGLFHPFTAVWIYLIVFVAALIVDVIPVISPPAWTIMVFMQMKFDLNIWGVLAAGVMGSTVGRYLLQIYMPKFADTIICRHKREDLEFLGKKLGQSTWRCWCVVLLHTFTPLSTSALFTAAGIAKVKPYKLLVPFVIGKSISDGAMILTGRYAAENANELVHSLFSVKAIAAMVISVIAIGLFLFIDWHLLLEKKKLVFRFKIWK